MLRRQRAIEIVPGSKPLRWRRYDIPQHLAPETSDALRFCAVEGDLDLLDRRHRSTIEAGSFVVSTGPPLARLWRMRPTLEDEWDLEPWDDDPDGVDAHYIRRECAPGRVWCLSLSVKPLPGPETGVRWWVSPAWRGGGGVRRRLVRSVPGAL